MIVLNAVLLSLTITPVSGADGARAAQPPVACEEVGPLLGFAAVTRGTLHISALTPTGNFVALQLDRLSIRRGDARSSLRWTGQIAGEDAEGMLRFSASGASPPGGNHAPPHLAQPVIWLTLTRDVNGVEHPLIADLALPDLASVGDLAASLLSLDEDAASSASPVIGGSSGVDSGTGVGALGAGAASAWPSILYVCGCNVAWGVPQTICATNNPCRGSCPNQPSTAPGCGWHLVVVLW